MTVENRYSIDKPVGFEAKLGTGKTIWADKNENFRGKEVPALVIPTLKGIIISKILADMLKKIYELDVPPLKNMETNQLI